MGKKLFGGVIDYGVGGSGSASANPMNGSAFPLVQYFKSGEQKLPDEDVNMDATTVRWAAHWTQRGNRTITKIVIGSGSLGAGAIGSVVYSLSIFATTTDAQGEIIPTGAALASVVGVSPAAIWSEIGFTLGTPLAATDGTVYVAEVQCTSAAANWQRLLVTSTRVAIGGWGTMTSTDSGVTWDRRNNYMPALGIVYQDGSYAGPPYVSHGNVNAFRNLSTVETPGFKSDDATTRWDGIQLYTDRDVRIHEMKIMLGVVGTCPAGARLVGELYSMAGAAGAFTRLGTFDNTYAKGASNTIGAMYTFRSAAGIVVPAGTWLFAGPRAHDVVQTTAAHIQLGAISTPANGANQSSSLLLGARALRVTKAANANTAPVPDETTISLPANFYPYMELWAA